MKRLREHAGLTARDAARLIAVDQAKMTHIEAGRISVGDATVRSLATGYGVTDHGLVDALAVMALERTVGWWRAYSDLLPRGFLDLAELEHHASYVRTVEVTQIPGLLQTEAHARSVFENGLTAELPQRELDARVAHRMERRAAFRQQSASPR
ncbi:helix-turn-helix domain-containing protein [Streptomyces sp. N2-109]|uniref:Helix-turn-helix domain-containing protein n=1 Tax=Streptomyces gossypii TaxID=2883101 RepID=A0ABT2JQS1_9ACTN|nr:helix-turn-helix domain-containing protein [Streptomyces gossypii]MCT2590210.1 helix-turn-helix domain-containing protein [Streptomyces gossypii]